MKPPSLARQVHRLFELGYPALLDTHEDEFMEALGPLMALGADTAEEAPPSRLPCILVVATPRLPVARLLPKAVRQGRAAVERLHPKASEDFKPVADLDLPRGEAYLLFDVDRGDDTLNKTPLESLPLLAAGDRSPLTVEEGVAILTHVPDFLQPNRCFMLLGSRGNDKRVPALWISEGRPKLGWCWAGNRHTWLGMASCTARSKAITAYFRPT
jgi:hypothetical protein